MRARDRRLARLVGVALFAYYLLIAGGHHYSIDGIVMFQSAKQLFFRHSLVLDPPVRWGPDVIRANPFSIGFTLAYLPALTLASPLFYWMPSLQLTPYDPVAPRNPALYGNLAYLLCAWLNPLITALTGSLVFVIARRLQLTPGWAVTTALVYGVASPAAAYARYDFAQPLAGLALTAAVCALLDVGRAGARRSLVTAGGALGAMFVTRPDLGVLIAWIGAWLAVDARRAGLRAVALRVSPLAVTTTAALALYLWANHARFGQWTQTGHAPVTWLFSLSGSRLVEGALGLLLSPGHGLLIFYPLAWLAVPGLYRLVRERHPAGTLCSGLIVTAFVFYACYRGWWAGWSWGPRFFVPLLPLLTVAATCWAVRGRRRGVPWRTRLFAGLAGLGAVIAGNGILFDFVLYYRWLEKVVRMPETAASQFDVVASPLVSGWRFLPTTSVDLLLLRMGEFAGRGGTIAAVLIASVLLACLVWSGRRIREALREEASSPVSS